MYQPLQTIHSIWAYIVVFIVLIAVLNAIAGTVTKRPFLPKDKKLALYALIAVHIQFLVGIITYVISPLALKNIQNSGMGTVMKDSLSRLYAIEHPLMMLIGVILITIGYSSHKNKELPGKKFKTLMIYYLIGFILILSRIPWAQWFS